MPVNTTFRHPLFAQIIKYSNIRYGRNISGTDCIPEKNERLVLTGCITANQYRSNLFMDRLFQWFRGTFFLFFHLLNQKLHGSLCNNINLLTNGCDWENCLTGNGRIIKSYDFIERG